MKIDTSRNAATDHRHRRLLCARRKRPRRGSAAKESDELAPS
jgi:hypothetical protein